MSLLKQLKNSIFLLKKQDKYLELPLLPFVIGIKQIRLALLELHQEYASIINKTYKTLLISVSLLIKNKKSCIVELVAQNKKTILTDKSIFLNNNTLITLWLQTSVQGLIGKEKVLLPFWNSQCKVNSQKLWLPTQIDCVDSHLNSSNGYWKQTRLNSLFSTNQMENPQIQNWQKTYYPLYISTHVDKWEKEDTLRARKIRLYPSIKQKKILNEWICTSRYVYNRALSSVKTGINKMNWMELRNQFVTAKNNDKIESWELNTPKDIRAGAIRDLNKAYNSAMSNLKRQNIKEFKLGYRKKKIPFSIEIPKSAISVDGYNVFLYKRFIQDKIRTGKDKSIIGLPVEYDCRLKNENNKWFLYVPYKAHMDHRKPKYEICSLDPGVRKFQTVYSENKVIKIELKKELLNKLYNKLDKYKSLRSNKKIKNTHITRRINKTNFKISNLINDMHYQLINELVTTYSYILLPSFESQDMMRRNKISIVNRRMNTLKHYMFQQRLKNKCELMKYSNMRICTEEYTSQTCGVCGVLNKELKTSETFNCKKCKLIIDRDINGARNIYIKNLL